MLRRLSAAFVALFVLAFTAGGVPAARADALASVSPGEGDMHTTFTFSASGLTPGHAIVIVLYDAAGNRYSYQKDGADQAIVVDDSGGAAVQVTPADDLPGSTPGAWHVVFTEEESGYAASISFDVSP